MTGVEKAKENLSDYIKDQKTGLDGEIENSQELLKLQLDLFDEQRKENQANSPKKVDTWSRPMSYADRAILTSVFTGPIGILFGNAIAHALKANEVSGAIAGFAVGVAVAILGNYRKK